MRGRRGRRVAVSVSMGEATKTCLSPRVRRCAHVVLRGRHGTLSHSTCVKRNVCVRDRRWTKVAVSMGEATKTRLSRLKLPCLLEKVPKRVFLDVSEDVLMSFCMAGVALCDIRRV